MSSSGKLVYSDWSVSKHATNIFFVKIQICVTFRWEPSLICPLVLPEETLDSSKNCHTHRQGTQGQLALTLELLHDAGGLVKIRRQRKQCKSHTEKSQRWAIPTHQRVTVVLLKETHHGDLLTRLHNSCCNCMLTKSVSEYAGSKQSIKHPFSSRLICDPSDENGGGPIP